MATQPSALFVTVCEVGAEHQCSGKRIAFFRKEDVPDAFAGVKPGDALLLDPAACLFLRDRILLSNRWIMVVENYDHLRRFEDFLAAHLAQQVGGARRAAVVEHHHVGNDVDDFPDLDALAVGVAGNNFRYGVHAIAVRSL